MTRLRGFIDEWRPGQKKLVLLEPAAQNSKISNCTDPKEDESMTDKAQLVRAVVEQIDPASDPEATMREKLQGFECAYLDAKGSEGGNVRGKLG
jgi:hypothetical protein